MKRTILTSFPRSGHHLLLGYLQSYYGPSLKYCDPYVCGDCPEANILKSHDLELLDPIQGDGRIVLTRRDKLAALQSWFDFTVRHGKQEDSQDSWKKFHDYGSTFYDLWLQKWTAVGPVFFYEDLVQQPQRVVFPAIQIISGGGNVIRAMKAILSPVPDPTRDGHFIETGWLRDTTSFRYTT